MLDSLIHSATGLFHTIAAVLAIIFGTIVILNGKGTKFHKRIGYVYVCFMLLLNISSFFIISFGSYSLFHFFTVVSLLTVLAGIVPALRKEKNWFPKHFYFMSWSVVGLYSALWAEIGTRLVTNNFFWWIVWLTLIVTVFIGSRIINSQAKKLKLK